MKLLQWLLIIGLIGLFLLGLFMIKKTPIIDSSNHGEGSGGNSILETQGTR
ncbi:MAG TPA: hypothetical protein PKC14_03130 [Candidatus Absconditabacterales bacterium]|nr:hypothetical protein [Candidatus Absconditabacterales bacterium]